MKIMKFSKFDYFILKYAEFRKECIKLIRSLTCIYYITPFLSQFLT